MLETGIIVVDLAHQSGCAVLRTGNVVRIDARGVLSTASYAWCERTVADAVRSVRR